MPSIDNLLRGTWVPLLLMPVQSFREGCDTTADVSLVRRQAQELIYFTVLIIHFITVSKTFCLSPFRSQSFTSSSLKIGRFYKTARFYTCHMLEFDVIHSQNHRAKKKLNIWNPAYIQFRFLIRCRKCQILATWTDIGDLNPPTLSGKSFSRPRLHRRYLWKQFWPPQSTAIISPQPPKFPSSPPPLLSPSHPLPLFSRLGGARPPNPLPIYRDNLLISFPKAIAMPPTL